MNRWKPFVFGIVITLVAGVSLSYAQEEVLEEGAAGLVEEEVPAGDTTAASEEGTGDAVVAEPEPTDGNEMIVDPEDEALDALLLDEEMTMFELIMKGGVVGGLIILLSCMALGLVIDYAITIRRSRLAPVEDISTFKGLVEKQDFAGVNALAK